MIATGNGNPELCVANLLQTIRGEIPLERLKGIDPSIFDKPSAAAVPQTRADIAWLLKTYEPRFNLKNVDIPALIAERGAFTIHADGSV
jgi:phage baseplate assembly protein W